MSVGFNFGRNVRRRTRGKSPRPLSTVAISIPFNPTALTDPPSSRGRFCYYSVLEISKTASAEQVRQAYRKRAMQLHPDKLISHLGRPPTANEVATAEDDYCRIVTAFDILSDEVLRMEYDAAYGGDVAAEPPPRQQPADPIDPLTLARQEARLILHACQFEDRKLVVAEFETNVLVALRNFLRGDKPVGTQIKKFDQRVKPRGSKKQLDQCMSFKTGCGYMVEMTFANVSMVTCCTWQLETALAWRAALTVFRSNATAKLRKFEGGDDPDSEMKKLFGEQFREALRIEPDMNVKFRFRYSKLSTPYTKNIYAAISDKLTFAKAKGLTRSEFKKVSSAAKKAAIMQKAECRSRCALVLAAVIEELEHRMENANRTMQTAEEDQAAVTEAQLREENELLKSLLAAERVGRTGCRSCSLKAAQAAASQGS